MRFIATSWALSVSAWRRSSRSLGLWHLLQRLLPWLSSPCSVIVRTRCSSAGRATPCFKIPTRLRVTRPASLLPRSVRDELLALACLAPLLYSDLRAPVSTTVVATDATPTRGAAASAVAPLLTARHLFAGAEFHGADARLVDRVDLPDEDAAPSADPALAAAFAARPWWQVCAAYGKEVDHINAQELRALVGLITRRCRSSANFKQRVVALNRQPQGLRGSSERSIELASLEPTAPSAWGVPYGCRRVRGTAVHPLSS